MEEQENKQERHYLEEERWRLRDQVRDWLLFLLLVALTVGWHLIVYFTEPGLR